MPEISTITVGNITYDLKDKVARQQQQQTGNYTEAKVVNETLTITIKDSKDD